MDFGLSGRKFGVEIECLTRVSRNDVARTICDAGVEADACEWGKGTYDYWRVIPDSSVFGYSREGLRSAEVVSPPLRGERGLEELHTVLDALKDIGAQTNSTCGLHVHHDARSESLGCIRNIARFYEQFEDTIGSFVSPHRRTYGEGNTYCSSFRGAWWLEAWYTSNDPGYDWRNRQATLNMRNIGERYGTVEFRQFDATLDYNQVASWIAFTQAIVDSASSGRINIKRPLRNLGERRLFELTGVKPDVAKCLRERAVYWTTAILDPVLSEEDEYDEDEYDYEEDPQMYVAPDGSLHFYYGNCTCAECTRVRNMAEG